MTSNADRLPSCPGRTWLRLVHLGIYLLLAGFAFGQGPKPKDPAALQKWLDEASKRTDQNQKGGAPRAGALPQPSTPAPAPRRAPAPVQTSPTSRAPTVMPTVGAGLAAAELFEDDFDQTGVVSFTQHRVVLLVFAPQPETDAWRTSNELQSWAQRAVICPVHEGSLGDRAQRLAKAFGVDSTKGAMLTALVRAPEGVKQVASDQLLYQVLGRYPAPQDAGDVIKVLQEGVAAYEAKKGQYAWNVTLTGANVPIPSASPPASVPASSAATPSPSSAPPANAPAAMPSPAGPSSATPSVATAPQPPTPPEARPTVTIKPKKPPEPARSPFERAVLSAWQTHRPVMLIFPGAEPFDKAKCTEIWRTIPGALAPELVVLTPGSSDGSIGGKTVDWEAFFDIRGQYPQALMILPETEDTAASPKVADMAYRVIARRHGPLTPESAEILARLWMSEDLDAVVMRAWVLRRPLLMVYPQPERERDLLDSPVLAKIEERAAVFVNTKDTISGIRRKTAAEIEKEFATSGVERAELVLVKLESKNKDAASVRLDQIQLAPVNRAFAKKSPDKILEWATSRVGAKPKGAGASQ